jgi:hypothetical protein
MPASIEGENSMDALKSVAVAVSGLVLVGTAALTVGAAIPASAGVVVSMPYQPDDDTVIEGDNNGDNDQKRIKRNRIRQVCTDTEVCNPQLQQTVGDEDRPRQNSRLGEDDDD